MSLCMCQHACVIHHLQHRASCCTLCRDASPRLHAPGKTPHCTSLCTVLSHMQMLLARVYCLQNRDVVSESFMLHSYACLVLILILIWTLAWKLT